MDKTNKAGTAGQAAALTAAPLAWPTTGEPMAPTAGHVAESLAQLAGELSCLMAMAVELVVRAEGEADMGSLWRLRALLGAMCLQSNELHDLAGRCAQGAAA